VYPIIITLKALHDHTPGRIGLIQLDAHCDLMDYSERQGRYSGSSGMRRSLELERMRGSNLVQVGLRGYTTVEQYEIGQQLGARRISATRFTEIGARAAATEALAVAGAGTDAIYLTVDMDAINPGTGWPEPGGLTGQQAIDFVRAGTVSYIAAMDIAEVTAPKPQGLGFNWSAATMLPHGASMACALQSIWINAFAHSYNASERKQSRLFDDGR
jgi:agmatinase